MKKMKVAVLGTGDVGRVLASGLLALGHEVKMGSREAGNPKALEWAREAGEGASTGTFKEAVSFAEFVVLATLGSATEDLVKSLGGDIFRGKIILDAANPIDGSDGMPKLSITGHDSLGERIQKLAPGARVVKAFNTVGNAHMVHPKFKQGKPDMFICGNDEGAKEIVTQICDTWDWGVVDLGGIENSRYLEAMCLVWVGFAIKTGTWNHAFKLLRE